MYMIYSKYCEDREREGLFPDLSVSRSLEKVFFFLSFSKTAFILFGLNYLF